MIVGANDVGKSTFLQLLFRFFTNGSIISGLSLHNVVYIPSHRIAVRESAEVGTETFEGYNGALVKILESGPLHTGRLAGVGGDVEKLWALLLHHAGNFEKSNDMFKKLVRSFDFPEHKLAQRLVSQTGPVETTRHGSGLRALFPIFAALSNETIKVVIIDEPEQSLEPYLQKKLKKALIESGKIVMAATHSHLFLSTNKEHKVSILEMNDKGLLEAHGVVDERELINITYRLLGNALEDLFFPNNFLIVEGATDQMITERVAQLLNIGPYQVKILSSRGVSSANRLYTALSDTLVPLISHQNPYKEKVVIMIDDKNGKNSDDFERLKNQFGNRFFHLTEKSLEEYLPDGLYTRAGRSKNDDIFFLNDTEKSDTEKENLKVQIAKQLSSVMRKEDLLQLDVIASALQKAVDNPASNEQEKKKDSIESRKTEQLLPVPARA